MSIDSNETIFEVDICDCQPGCTSLKFTIHCPQVSKDSSDVYCSFPVQNIPSLIVRLIEHLKAIAEAEDAI